MRRSDVEAAAAVPLPQSQPTQVQHPIITAAAIAVPTLLAPNGLKIFPSTIKEITAPVNYFLTKKVIVSAISYASLLTDRPPRGTDFTGVVFVLIFLNSCGSFYFFFGEVLGVHPRFDDGLLVVFYGAPE